LLVEVNAPPLLHAEPQCFTFASRSPLITASTSSGSSLGSRTVARWAWGASLRVRA